MKGERGSRNTANEDTLRELARIDFIQDLEIVPGQQVSFRFRDLNTRAWLRDVGSALELYAYKACVDSAIFHDVISSAVVRWDEVLGHGSVSNEIDVMAARGVIPLFLSCKACDIKTEALNELAIHGTASAVKAPRRPSSPRRSATPPPATGPPAGHRRH